MSQASDPSPESQDHWELYPCEINGKTAWIAYDHGIRERIQEDLPDQIVRIRIQCKFADGEGHPHPNEFEDLEKVEAELTRRFVDFQGRLVGRITVEGVRHLIYYSDVPEESLVDFVATVSRATGYELQYLTDVDSEKRQYWSELFPGIEEWQAIRDRHAITDLMRSGIDLNQPASLLHLGGFHSHEAAQEYGIWLEQQGYQVQGIFELNSEEFPFRIAFAQQVTPQLLTLIEHTVPMLRKAKALQGQYFGWQVPVESPETSSPNSASSDTASSDTASPNSVSSDTASSDSASEADDPGK